MPALPARPSADHLRKEAKRLARERTLPLAEAQRTLAETYGFRNWAALMREVSRLLGERDRTVSPLLAAVRAGDIEGVRGLLAQGVNPRVGDGRDTPLNVAARRGPLALVEALIAGGALVWQPDGAGHTALHAARRGRSRERSAIISLLDRGRITDPSFRAAVTAIHAGDLPRLERLLDERPSLMNERNVGPEAYRMAVRHDYFRDPKLFWFIAGNPTIVERMAPNILDVAGLMIERGVERSDLDYTLALVMTSSAAREQGHQIALMRLLAASGASADRAAILSTAAHKEIAALRELLAGGEQVSAPIAAALGDDASLALCLAEAGPEDVQAAFGLAVINGHTEAARLALDSGADVNAFLPVHSHATALHQAAADERADLIEFLLSRGARSDVRDTLWGATPLQWAERGAKKAVRAALESKHE